MLQAVSFAVFRSTMVRAPDFVPCRGILMSQDLAQRLTPVRTIAAGCCPSLEIYDTNFDVETKDDDSPLTAATAPQDVSRCRADSATLTSRCCPKNQGAAVRATGRVVALLAGRPARWQIQEPIKRNGEFTVNIALIDGHRPVLGTCAGRQ